VAVIILTFSEYICQPFAYHINNMPAESQEIVKKIIALLGLGQQPSVRQSPRTIIGVTLFC
jgi:hypothetical protein